MKDRPAHPLVVVAAAIEKDSTTLIAQRRADASIEPNLWEFPGGKVEFGERPEAALKREILEELNLRIEVGDLIGVSSHLYAGAVAPVHVVLLCYRCRLAGPAGKLKNIQVQAARWIESKAYTEYTFAAADVALLQKVFRVVGDA